MTRNENISYMTQNTNVLQKKYYREYDLQGKNRIQRKRYRNNGG